MFNDVSTSVGIPFLCAQAVALGQGGGGCQLPKCLILNAAVGGRLGVSVATSAIPMTMEFDYARIHQNIEALLY
jgi:hypothetical protein